MRKKLSSPVLLLAAFLVGVLLLPAGTAVSQELQDIRVLNFPDPQRIEGTVQVDGPIRSTRMIRFAGLTVSPVPPEQTNRLVHAGTLDADGFSHVVLSLVCQARGVSSKPGVLGAILVPAEPRVREAFDDHGKLLLPLHLDARAEAGPPTFFASQGGRMPLAFPRYEVYLYNTTQSAVGVDVHAYLSNG